MILISLNRELGNYENECSGLRKSVYGLAVAKNIRDKSGNSHIVWTDKITMPPIGLAVNITLRKRAYSNLLKFSPQKKNLQVFR